MPLYDMKCTVCEYAEEVMRSFKDGPPKECPKCGKELKQNITPPTVHIHYSPMHPRAGRGRG